MPRKSAEALLLDKPVRVVTRPDAPYDLTDEEADAWRAVVNSMPADHFNPAQIPLLSQYCKHIVMARRMGQLVQRELARKQVNYDRLDQVARLQARESDQLVRLSRTMRLSQHAQYEAKTVTRRLNRMADATVPAPWYEHEDGS
jgi:hypothetical protein